MCLTVGLGLLGGSLCPGLHPREEGRALLCSPSLPVGQEWKLIRQNGGRAFLGDLSSRQACRWPQGGEGPSSCSSSLCFLRLHERRGWSLAASLPYHTPIPAHVAPLHPTSEERRFLTLGLGELEKGGWDLGYCLDWVLWHSHTPQP